jgi:hypothetical protein
LLAAGAIVAEFPDGPTAVYRIRRWRLQERDAGRRWRPAQVDPVELPTGFGHLVPWVMSAIVARHGEVSADHWVDMLAEAMSARDQLVQVARQEPDLLVRVNRILEPTRRDERPAP